MHRTSQQRRSPWWVLASGRKDGTYLSCMPTQTLPLQRCVSPSALVRCCPYSSTHQRSLQVVDQTPDVRAAMSAKYCTNCFATLEELIESGLPIDGVLIATPHDAHFALAMIAIEAGLHVLIEKPMTTTSAEAAILVKAAKEGGKLCMVNNSANFREQAKQAMHLVRSGAIGQVRHVQAHMGSPLLQLFHSTDRPTWQKPVGVAGISGFGWGQLSHILSWVILVTELQPADVFAFIGQSDRTGADLSDAVAIRCTNGSTMSLSGTALVPQGLGKQIDLRLFGDKGMLVYCGDDSDPTSGSLKVTDRAGNTIPVETDGQFLFEDTDQAGIGPASLGAFIDGCLGREYFEGASAELGETVVRILEAMYKSAKGGNAEQV